MKLEITEILSFYELPQIVVARNVFGTQFLMLLESDETELGLQYLSVPVSNEKLNLFKGKKIDLLSIYTKPEVDQYYLMYTKGDNEFLIKQINLAYRQNKVDLLGILFNTFKIMSDIFGINYYLNPLTVEAKSVYLAWQAARNNRFVDQVFDWILIVFTIESC